MKQPDEDLQTPAAELSKLWRVISPARYPNLLPYQMWIKSSVKLKPNITPVYLIRQYVQSNLHDRLSTRPFLSEIEKLWLLYQLFKGIEVCHLAHGIIHGDIKVLILPLLLLSLVIYSCTFTHTCIYTPTNTHT